MSRTDINTRVDALTSGRVQIRMVFGDGSVVSFETSPEFAEDFGQALVQSAETARKLITKTPDN